MFKRNLFLPLLSCAVCLMLGVLGGVIFSFSLQNLPNMRQIAREPQKVTPDPDPAVDAAPTLAPETDAAPAGGEDSPLQATDHLVDNLAFLDKLPVVFQASAVCFDLLRDIDTYESVACACDASQVPAPLHRKIAVQTRALNSWVKSSTVWKGKGQWIKERH